jgi:hypothetical protein
MKEYLLIAAGLTALHQCADCENTDGFKVLSAESVGSRNVTGSPVPATQQRHTLHFLGDRAT